MVRILAGLLCIGLCLAASVSLHMGLVSLHETYPTEFRSYYVPSSAYLQVASLGQKNFWADLVFIWSIQYFDRYAQTVRDTYLFHTYDVITDLDPSFQEAYIFGDLFLSLDKRWDLLYKLADKGIAKNPRNWLIPWDAGTYAFFQHKDYATALKYFRLAWERSPSDARLQDLVANAYKYKGDYEDSLRYWTNLKNDFDADKSERGRYFYFTAERNIFDLTIKIDLRRLSEAVNRYHQDKGEWPHGLAALEQEGFIKTLPLDPAGQPYEYDRATGEVSCLAPFKFRGKAAQW